MNLIRKHIFLIIIVISFLFLRLWNLEKSVNFGTDQGLALLESYNVFQTKKLTLIGATGSSWTAQGRYIFFSSYPYFLYLPVLIASNWNPLSLSYLFIGLNLGGLLLFCFTIVKFLKNRSFAAIFSIFFSFTPLLIRHSQFVWSPNLLIIISLFLIPLLVILGKTKIYKNILLSCSGLVLGIGMAVHFSFLGAVVITMIWLIRLKWFKLKYILIVLCGFLLGFSPLIIFDLRHDFYNLKTAFFILTSANNSNIPPVFNFNYHYILPIVPFIIFAISRILAQAGKVYRMIPVIICAFVIIYSLNTIIPSASHGFNMTDGWNYPGIKKIEKVILAENLMGFNLVDLLTGDTRAMALRAILTSDGKPPLGLIDYPATDYLFVYSKDSIEKILSGQLWEIDSVRPVKLSKTWDIQNGVFLYLLERQKPNK